MGECLAVADHDRGLGLRECVKNREPLGGRFGIGRGLGFLVDGGIGQDQRIEPPEFHFGRKPFALTREVRDQPYA